jgi:hypothetical protein
MLDVNDSQETMMRRLMFIPASAVLLALPILAACGDDNSAKTPTHTPTTAVASATAGGSSTPAPTTSPATTASPTTPAADGTVDPLGAGQQTPWTVKSDPDPSSAVVVLTDVRMGVHPEEGGWERIVFEFEGAQRPAATIQYATKATACGSGEAVSIDGTAILEVAIVGADAHDASGKATVPKTIDGPGTTVKGGQLTCDFEAHVTWDFGLTAKHNFKVTTLTNPTRIVVDVKQ